MPCTSSETDIFCILSAYNSSHCLLVYLFLLLTYSSALKTAQEDAAFLEKSLEEKVLVHHENSLSQPRHLPPRRRSLNRFRVLPLVQIRLSRREDLSPLSRSSSLRHLLHSPKPMHPPAAPKLMVVQTTLSQRSRPVKPEHHVS